MELKNLNTFRTIVEEGSFTKAAEKLSYSQSTITFQIDQLEQAFSTPLFEKIGRKMVLTKAGEQLVPYVEEVFRSVERLHGFSQDLSSCQGSLRVGVAETQLCYRMPQVLKEFHSRAPRARLYLYSMNCYEIRDALLDGKLDLGVFYGDVGGLDGLEIQEIGRFPLALVASPAVKAQFPDFVTPGQRLPIPFLINEPNCIFRQIFEAYLLEKSIVLDHTMELWSIPTIQNLVKNNVGVSFLPRFAVQEALDRGELEEIPTDLGERTIRAVCGCHKNKWRSPLMELFWELCR